MDTAVNLDIKINSSFLACLASTIAVNKGSVFGYQLGTGGKTLERKAVQGVVYHESGIIS